MRYISGLILGAQVYFCANGSVAIADDDGNTLSSRLVCPALPDGTTSEVEPWLSMGKIFSANPEFENKEIDIEGCDDSLDDDETHGYNTETITAQNKKSYKFTTKYITAEAFELSHALLANDDRPYIEGWLYARHIDSLEDAGSQELTHVALYGRLSLTSSLAAGSSDAVTAEFSLSIIKNSLATSSIAALETRLEGDA